MSPPNATPQHNAADDVTQEKQLDHVVGKQHVEIAAEKEPVAAQDFEPAAENLALGRSTPPPEPSEKAAGKAPVQSPSPPPPPPKDYKYLTASNVPSRATSPMSQGRSSRRNSEDGAAEDYPATKDGSGDAVDNSQAEIQNIMEQFQGNEGPGEEEIMSPRLELASPMLESPTTPHPPRQSSLVPHDKPLPTPTDAADPKSPLQSPPPRTSSLYRVGTNTSFTEPTSPSAHASKYKPAQPAPEPEPDLPFDFHRFLEQLRHRTADPVAKFLRSFLVEFGKKQWMVHEQVKIIGDFLEFISKKMAQCEVWRTVSDAEFDNAREGMEKLVMNRLYNQTFSPAIPPPEPVSPRKGRRRQDPPGPGRRGQHQEDVERDEVLAQKVRIYKWVSEEHLDIKPVGEKGRKFLHLAQQELLKIKSYRAPRDKIICILNCCKVIFGFLRTSSSDQSADAFVPLLIYTVLQANPDHLVSNVQYILRFRNQDKLGGEAGYYISSLMGAVQFIEGLDKTSLTVSDEEFEKNVEAAVSAIAERHAAEEAEAESSNAAATALLRPTTPIPQTRPLATLPPSSEDEQPEEEHAAVAGLLRTIQRPLSTIGRIFSDNDTHNPPSSASAPTTAATTPKPGTLQHRPSTDQFPGQFSEKPRRSHDDGELQQKQRLSASDAAARQASVEAEEARRIQRKEHEVVVETLTGMFPQLDRDVIDDVVRQKEGRVGLAVDACLALANP
ncbi:guanine nucleotide exchange factor Vps9 [Pyrenophora seminiperda CCB06]|uniref:Guanine nucleotide exchange factor Vps9 n=1 Tax=Pyrenophora seminiperda CCB06 TaxID=1302712 RepID=A0A3M7M7Y5_9PLEO|nr:guanine nucleotide exchange factor Vps9 [Pyrenophora seminiperda CCB06]